MLSINTYSRKGGGYVSLWDCGNKSGRAVSTVSPEATERNAIKQAKRTCDLTDYNGNPQAACIERRLNQPAID